MARRSFSATPTACTTDLIDQAGGLRQLINWPKWRSTWEYSTSPRSRYVLPHESSDPSHATIKWRRVAFSLFATKRPEWTRDHAGNEIIALVVREWNRQQVSLAVAGGRVRVTGGDGWERTNLFTAEIANNCLNAGLWEILLFQSNQGAKRLYCQGWFTFPLGHFRRLIEHNTGIRCGDHWSRPEHWRSPEGTSVNLPGPRRIIREEVASVHGDAAGTVVTAGEQARKVRTTQARNLGKAATGTLPLLLPVAGWRRPLAGSSSHRDRRIGHAS